MAVVVPRSHKKFVSLLESGAGPEDMQASLMSPEALADGIIAELKGGDCFLWDSRTSHGASPGLLTAEATEAEAQQLFRAAGYVCMAPASHASPRTLAQREEMLLAHQGTGAFCATFNEGTGRQKESAEGVFKPVLQDMGELDAAQWALVRGTPG